jgi:signal transduction histidine kinase
MPSPEELQAQLDEQVQLNERLREATEHFIGAVAHDVKNPLAAIKINVQGLRRRIDRGDVDPEQLGERLARIEHSVEQVLETLAAARSKVASAATEAQPPLRLEPVDLVDLTREIVATLHAAPRHTIRIEPAQPVLVGLWDEGCLRRTLHELLTNALKFSPDGPDIIVRLRREEGSDGPAVSLDMCDQGIGIPERDLPYVFDRFHRGENVLGRFPGAGLGLFRVRQDVERHGGRVTAASGAERGCIVSLRLPTRRP